MLEYTGRGVPGVFVKAGALIGSNNRLEGMKIDSYGAGRSSSTGREVDVVTAADVVIATEVVHGVELAPDEASLNVGRA